MLKTIAALLLLIPKLAQGFDIDSGISGSWYDPDHSGHGFSIEVLDQDSILVYWYFYTPYGDSAFALGVGTYQGDTVTAELSYPYGMLFGTFAPSPEKPTWGTVTIQFSSCTRGNVEYDSSFQFDDGAIFDSGTFPIERLASIESLDCPADDPPLNDPDHGENDASDPGVVSNLRGGAIWDGIMLNWDFVDVYNFAFVEIWASETPSINGAELIGTTGANSFVHDDIGLNETRWYWVRIATRFPVYGNFAPASSGPGLQVSTASLR